MKVFIACLILTLALPWGIFAQTSPRQEQLFNLDWRFSKGGLVGAENISFNDSGWRQVDLPHDWSIEDIPGTSSPFHRDAVGQQSTGFTVGGTGWYRKKFSVPENWIGKRFIIQFDGVYQNSVIWLNGQPVGEHRHGYTGFWFDITEQVQPGKENILVVKVMNEGANTRWYSGSGIYRDVWLKVTEPVHVPTWGTFVVTSAIDGAGAKMNMKTTIVNQSENPGDLLLITSVKNSEGKIIARVESKETLEQGETRVVNQDFAVPSPELWSPTTPTLYTAQSQVFISGKFTDMLDTRFGIRMLEFNSEKGFLLNGKPLLLKGGCVHHDNGPLGAKVYPRAEERRVEILKASGFNAIRSAHNPPSPAFLDACDRLGMLVINEAFDMWEDPKTPYDYHLYFPKWWEKDMENMINSSRNHPSIIMWSIGNEIPNMEKPGVVNTAGRLAAKVRELDPSRPVTAGVHGVSPGKDPFFDKLDIAGYNYAFEHYRVDKKRMHNRIMYGSESSPFFAFDYWMGVLDNPFVIGDFVWTAFDYIGEASIGWRGFQADEHIFPWTLAYCGDIDICGWKRPQSYYRDVLWGQEKSISLFVTPPQPTFPINIKKESWSNWHWHDVRSDWNWPGHEGENLEVQVYSSHESVELFLNGKSLGSKPTNRSTEYIARWEVPYQPGELIAQGRDGRRKTSKAMLATAGEVRSIRLNPDRDTLRPDGQDLVYIEVELVDKDGRVNPKAESLVQFEIEGPGEIIAVGNANPVSLESYTQPRRKAWQGRCLVIVKSGNEQGIIVLNALSNNLQSAKLEVIVK